MLLVTDAPRGCQKEGAAHEEVRQGTKELPEENSPAVASLRPIAAGRIRISALWLQNFTAMHRSTIGDTGVHVQWQAVFVLRSLVRLRHGIEKSVAKLGVSVAAHRPSRHERTIRPAAAADWFALGGGEAEARPGGAAGSGGSCGGLAAAGAYTMSDDGRRAAGTSLVNEAWRDEALHILATKFRVSGDVRLRRKPASRPLRFDRSAQRGRATGDRATIT
jgi:hypothetical protein